jgi:hypothetical protein
MRQVPLSQPFRACRLAPPASATRCVPQMLHGGGGLRPGTQGYIQERGFLEARLPLAPAVAPL